MPARWKPVREGPRAAFANRLREVVHAQSLPVSSLAEECRTSRATLYAVLAGERLPTRWLLEELLDQCRVTSKTRRELLVLWERLSMQERSQRRPPAPPVKVGVVPEQQAFAEAFAAFIEKYRHDVLLWTSALGEGHLQRFVEGRAIPSPGTLYFILYGVVKPSTVSDRRWREIHRELDELIYMAIRARYARRQVRDVLRRLQGGSR